MYFCAMVRIYTSAHVCVFAQAFGADRCCLTRRDGVLAQREISPGLIKNPLVRQLIKTHALRADSSGWDGES